MLALVKTIFFRKYYSRNIFSSLVWAVLHEYLPGCLRLRATVSSRHQMKRANAVFWEAGFSVPCKESLFSRIFGQFHIQHICCMALSHCFCAAAFVGFEKSGIFISLRRFTFMESRKGTGSKWNGIAEHTSILEIIINVEIYEKLRMAEGKREFRYLSLDLSRSSPGCSCSSRSGAPLVFPIRAT